MNLSVFFKLGRVSNLPTVFSNVILAWLYAKLAGLPELQGAFRMKALFEDPLRFLLMGEKPGWVSLISALWAEGIPLALSLVSMTLLYTGGMFLNDFVDAKVDEQNGKKRPIVMGLVSRNTTGTFALILLVLSAFFMLVAFRFDPAREGMAGTFYFLLVFVVVFYNFFHRNASVAAVLMGLSRVLVYGTIYLIFSPDDRFFPGIPYLIFIFAYVMLITLVARGEDQYENGDGKTDPRKSFSLFSRIRGNDPGSRVMKMIALIALLDGVFALAIAGLAAIVPFVLFYFLTLQWQKMIRGT